MQEKPLKEIAKLILEDKIPEDYKIPSFNNLTYKIGDRYIKKMKKEKIGFLKKILRNTFNINDKVTKRLNKLSEIIEKLNKNRICTYTLSEYLTLDYKNEKYIFYETNKVEGKRYDELDKNAALLYMLVMREAIKMVKLGFYKYDINPGNFFITKKNKVIFIDLDDVERHHIFSRKYMMWSLANYYNNLETECRKNKFNEQNLKDEFFTIIEEELNISKEKIKKQIESYLKMRKIRKKIIEKIKKSRRKIINKISFNILYKEVK